LGVVLIIRYFTSGQVTGGRLSSPYDLHSYPLQIIKERYAKGDIDTQEFEERKRILDGGR
jgi:uncharacterized membrane protein